MNWFSIPKFRRVFFQLLAGAAVLAFFGFIFYNTAVNLQAQGRGLSFDFLHNRAGFAISQHLIPYSDNDDFARVFWVGLLNTLLISVLAAIGATILGVLLGVLRLSHNWLMARLVGAYVDLFRNIPLLLQLFFWYFAVLAVLPAPRASALTLGCNAEKACMAALSNRGLVLVKPHWDNLLIAAVGTLAAGIVISLLLQAWNKRRQARTGKRVNLMGIFFALILVLPLAVYFIPLDASHYQLPQLKGFNYQNGINILPEFAALWLALTLYSAAYIAEYVRAGIQSVPKGQFEAAASLGLSQSKIMRLVILPQALRVIIPPLTNQYLNVVKNSSLATAIAYPDLVSVFTGTSLNITGRAVEIIAITMAVYLCISLAISLGMNLYNRAKRLKER